MTTRSTANDCTGGASEEENTGKRTSKDPRLNVCAAVVDFQGHAQNMTKILLLNF